MLWVSLRFRVALLTGAAAVPLCFTQSAQAQTVCSQAGDGSVECTEGVTIVATGTMTPGTVIEGPGLNALSLAGDLAGSLAGDISTNQVATPGVSFQSNGEIDFGQDGNVQTNGQQSAGLLLDGQYVTLSVGNVATAGNESNGIDVSADAFFGAEARVTAGNISTTGDNSIALRVRAFNDEGGLAGIDVGDVTTSGVGSHGVIVRTDSALVNCGDITTTGDGSNALQVLAEFERSANVTCGNIVATGSGSRGVNVDSYYGATLSVGDVLSDGAAIVANSRNLGVLVTGGTVATLGSGEIAVSATADGGISLTLGNVTATGDGSSAIYGRVSFGDAEVDVGDVDSDSTAIDLSVGTPGYAGSGNIAVVAGNVTTRGDGAAGILLTGDVVTLGVGDVTTLGDDSPAIDVEGLTSADVTCGDISTSGRGTDAVRVVATDFSASASLTCGDISATGEGSRGIQAGAAGDVTVNAGNVISAGSGVAVSTSEGRLRVELGDVSTLGSDAEAVVVNVSDGSGTVTCGNVSTVGDNSSGIETYASDGSVSVTCGDVRTEGSGSFGVSHGSDGLLTLGEVATLGSGSPGVIISSDFGARADIGGITTSGDDSVGLQAYSDSVDVAVGQITTTGANSHGIVVESGGEAALAIGGVSVAGVDADAIKASVGSITLDIAGAVSAAEGHALRLTGGPASVNVSSTGSIDGQMGFGDGADTLTNDGLVNLRGTNDFGAGTDLFTNNNLLVVNGQAGFANLEQFRNNGTIDLQDGATDDRLTFNGAYAGGDDATILVDVSRSLDAADVLAIGGDISGRTILAISWVDSDAPLNPAGVLLVDGVSNPGMFTVEGLEDSGLFALRLRERGGDLYLVAAIDPSTTDLALLGLVAPDLWYQSFDGMRASIAGRGSFLPRLGFWAQAYGGQDRSGKGGTAEVFGAEIPVSSRLATDRLGGQVGFDGSVGAVLIGVTAGYGRAKSDAGIASGVDAKGFNVGAYAGIGAAVGPYAMVAVKHDWVDLDVHSPTFAVPNINAVNTGADVELGWRGSLVALSFDVNAGLSVVRTRIDDFAIAGTDFQFGSSTSTRGRLGGRATFNGPFRPFAEARLFHEFGEPGGLRVISGDAEDKLDIAGRGSWARIEAGVGGGNDRALLSAWADLGDREGWGLRAGFKF